jgi:hypothetical protein
MLRRVSGFFAAPPNASSAGVGCGRSTPPRSRATEPGLEVDPVARWQHARRLVGEDRNTGEEGAFLRLSAPGKIGERRLVGDVDRRRDTTGVRDADQIDGAVGVARLHPGLGVASVVEDRDRQIGRRLDADRRQRAKAHQRVAVAGHHQHRPIGPRDREAKPDHRRAAHRAPQIEIALVIGDRSGVVGRRAEPGHHQHVAPFGQQHADRRAPVEA